MFTGASDAASEKDEAGEGVMRLPLLDISDIE